jgi:hypothetical protein
MKNLILLLAIIVFSINTQAQQNLTSISSNGNQKSYSRTFVRTTSVPLDRSNVTIYLPLKAKWYLKENFKGYKTRKLIKVTSAEDIVSYQVIVNGMDLIFDSEGNYLKSVKF